jgi:hypothetical protein
MSVTPHPEARVSGNAPEPDDRVRRFAVSFSGSIAIHALLLFLLISGIELLVVPTEEVVAPVDVVLEEPVARAEAPVPERPAPQPPPPSSAPQLKGGFDMREIADEERQQKALLGKEIRDGQGAAQAPSASSASDEKRKGEELDKDPRKEISRLVPPREKEPKHRHKAKIAPPGPDRQPSAKDQPKEDATDESTRARQPIRCGANAKTPTPATATRVRAQVLGQMTRDQAERMMEINQANADMYISPDFGQNIRIFVHIDEEPDGSWRVALLPSGLSVRRGDHVEIIRWHLDPSRPCHYIPPLVSRVLE